MADTNYIDSIEVEGVTRQIRDTAGAVRYDAAQSLTAAQIAQVLANIGAAPSGYGLGTSAQKCTDLNDAVKNGWYSCVGAANLPPNVQSAQYGAVLVMTHDTDRIMQMYEQCVTGGTHTIAFRWKDGSGWSDWEFLNPLLAVNVEYKTVERWNGDPVYAMSVRYKFTQTYTDSFSLEIPHGIENFGNLIKAEIVQPPYSYPYVDSSGGMAGVKYVNATNIVFDSYKVGFRTGNILNFVLHYTKTT